MGDKETVVQVIEYRNSAFGIIKHANCFEVYKDNKYVFIYSKMDFLEKEGYECNLISILQNINVYVLSVPEKGRTKWIRA